MREGGRSRDGEDQSRGQEDVTGLIRARRNDEKSRNSYPIGARDQSREEGAGGRRANREIAVVRPKIPSVPIKQVTAADAVQEWAQKGS